MGKHDESSGGYALAFLGGGDDVGAGSRLGYYMLLLPQQASRN